MHHAMRAGVLALVLGSAAVAACASPSPSPAATGPASPVPAATRVAASGTTPTGAAVTEPGSPGVAAAPVPLNVRFAGDINCATFPYNCTATLSVVDAEADVADSWRPESEDPYWIPDYGNRTTTHRFAPTPVGPSPVAEAGSHRLVVSLLGWSDVPSTAPDGTRAVDLLGRCTADVDIAAGATGLDVVVTFAPDAASFRATCTLAVDPA